MADQGNQRIPPEVEELTEAGDLASLAKQIRKRYKKAMTDLRRSTKGRDVGRGPRNSLITKDREEDTR